MHITDLLDRNGRYFPDQVAYYSQRGDLTWAMLRHRARSLASALGGFDVGAGDRVAVLLHEDVESVEVWYACLYAGALRCGINPRFTAREIAEIFAMSTPRVVVVSRSLVETARAAASSAGLGELPLIVVDRGAQNNADGYLDYEDYERAIADNEPLAPMEYAHDTDIAICFSSGSTGRPKGVIWSNDRLLASIYNCVVALGLQRDDVWLRNLPTFGVGILMTTWNALPAFPCVLSPRFEVGDELELIQRYGVTGFTGSATTLRRLIDHPEFDRFDLSSLRRVMYGQAPASPSLLLRAAERLDCDLVQMYGMTEGHGLFTIFDGSDHRYAFAHSPQRLLAAGRPLPYAKIRIVDDLEDLPAGSIGEVCVRGDSVAKGYYGDDELTAAAFVDGWLHTGDVGYLDEDGFLYIVDRKNFMIVSGGFNIYPAEVEHVIEQCDCVREVAVVGRPDEEWGEAVVAVVMPTDGTDQRSARAEILQHCRENLAGFKVPKAIEFWDELPIGPTGKLLKRDIRDRLVGEQSRAVFGPQ